jgi:hypothetical protein
MEILVGDPRNGIFPWKTMDGHFTGYLISGFKMTPSDGGGDVELPAGALLAVPKNSPNERPSINKYSPVVVTAKTVEELPPLLELWTEANQAKTLWSLRSR